MATRAQKIRVGMFTAATGALVAFALIVFGGMRFWENTTRYRIVFADTVYGLETGAHVYLNGMRAGKVSAIRPAPGDLRKVEVEIDVRESTPIRTDTHAMLQYAGITGLKVIDLRDGSLGAPPLPAGGTIAQGVTILDKLEQQAETLADQSGKLMARASQIVDNLVAVTDPARFAAMSDIMTQAKVTADHLAASSATLDAIVGENRVALKRSIESIEVAAQRAAALLDGELGKLVGSSGELVSDLRSVVHDTGGTLRSAMLDLRQASRSFKELAREVRQKPSRLLFSGTLSDRTLP